MSYDDPTFDDAKLDPEDLEEEGDYEDEEGESETESLIEEDIELETDADVYQSMTVDNVPTLPVLTRYEVTYLIGCRAQQIEEGAPPLIDASEFVDSGNTVSSKTIAARELELGKMPLFIRRPLPNNTHSNIDPNKMVCLHPLDDN